MSADIDTAWRLALQKAFPQGHAEGFPGYPLLGQERPEAPARQVTPWKIRVALRTVFEADQMRALLEDVEELRWLVPVGAGAGGDVGLRELYCVSEAPPGAWTLQSEAGFDGAPFPVQCAVWGQAGQELTEWHACPDGQILKNLAWLSRRGEDQRWVVSSSRASGGEAEELLADTLAYWTGAVAGVSVLEVAEQAGETFESLWNRLCAVRLLRHEAELGSPGDPLAGAGFFAQLGEAL